MRISDWSSDVCSSDLVAACRRDAIIIDNDLRTLARHQQRIGSPEPAARSGYDRNFAIQQTDGALLVQPVLPEAITPIARLVLAKVHPGRRTSPNCRDTIAFGQTVAWRTDPGGPRPTEL